MVHKTVFKACNKPNMPQLRQQRQQPLKRILQLIMKPMLAKSPNWNRYIPNMAPNIRAAV